MGEMRPKQRWTLALTLGPTLALGACTGALEGPPPVGVNGLCTTPDVAWSPLRRLTRVEYVNSAGDLLGVDGVAGIDAVRQIARDERLGTLFPHKADARSYYEGKPDVVASTALRNSSLQGAYLMLAARLLGLDCGPMSGFDPVAVDKAFWSGTAVRTNFLCCLGRGDFTQMKSRNPRLTFDEVCRIL